MLSANIKIAWYYGKYGDELNKYKELSWISSDSNTDECLQLALTVFIDTI